LSNTIAEDYRKYRGNWLPKIWDNLELNKPGGGLSEFNASGIIRTGSVQDKQIGREEPGFLIFHLIDGLLNPLLLN